MITLSLWEDVLAENNIMLTVKNRTYMFSVSFNDWVDYDIQPLQVVVSIHLYNIIGQSIAELFLHLMYKNLDAFPEILIKLTRNILALKLVTFTKMCGSCLHQWTFLQNKIHVCSDRVCCIRLCVHLYTYLQLIFNFR